MTEHIDPADGGPRADDEVPPWEFTEKGLVILEDLSDDEWSTLWSTACGLHRQALWSLGDAAVYAEDHFGDRSSQLVTDYAPSTVRGAISVARRFPYARRRPGLSWSFHKAIPKSMPFDEQEELLDRAQREGWHTPDLARFLQERKEAAEAAARYPSNGAPAHDPDDDHGDADEPSAGAAADLISQDESDAGDQPYVIGVDLASGPDKTAYWPIGDAGEALRDLQRDIRAVMPEFARGRAYISDVRQLSYRLARIVGQLGGDPDLRFVELPLLSSEAAERLIPAGWRITKTADQRDAEGRRNWQVTLRADHRSGLAAGMLQSEAAAVADAAISAIVSDLQAGVLQFDNFPTPRRDNIREADQFPVFA